jgi:acyl dehydratase
MAHLTIDDLQVGDSYAEEITFDEDQIALFIKITNDTSGIHTNREFSREKQFDNLVVHGFLLSVHFSRILGMELPGENIVIGSIDLKFHEPVYLGEVVSYSVTVTRVIHSLGSVLLELKITKPNGSVCVEGKSTCVFRKYKPVELS